MVEIKKRVSREKIYFWLIILLLVYVVYLSINFFQLKEDYLALKNREFSQNNFTLVSAEVSGLSIEEFLEKQETMTISYRGLSDKVTKTLEEGNGYFGLYLEDLTTGAWMGINEKENRFVPASLLKMPYLVAVMKKVEKGEINLTDKIKLKKADLDSRSGSLWRKGEGYDVTIEGLLDYLVKDSDNTAANVLKNRILTTNEIIEAQYAMGLPAPEELADQKMSPKSYSNLLRSLYLSSYLRRTFSEKVLSIMIDTNFDSGIPSKLPENINVAHKVGVHGNGGYYHDCGIIYAPGKPYILCVMSANSTQKEADKIISDVSKIIYDYVIES